jgi:hypothetical protein
MSLFAVRLGMGREGEYCGDMPLTSEISVIVTLDGTEITALEIKPGDFSEIGVPPITIGGVSVVGLGNLLTGGGSDGTPGRRIYQTIPGANLTGLQGGGIRRLISTRPSQN